MNLSEAQARALGKLTGEWQSAKALRESITTLDVLVKKGLAEHRGYKFNDINWRRLNNLYRLKNGGENAS